MAQQQGITDSLVNYYDIMIIGKTGMGKSTTADKLLIANPTQQQNEAAQHSEPDIDAQTGRMSLQDFVMWNLRDTPDEIKRVTTRLKNLAFFRGLENSHDEVNQAREAGMSIYGVTKVCEVISNENSKIRVLDVPGFFGADSVGDDKASANKMAESICNNDLGIMRNILHVQAAMNVKFSRILYFLPEKGPLTRPNAQLQLELKEMVHYFGRSVFDCMALVATVPVSTYDLATPDIPESKLFSDKSIRNTRKYFQEAIGLALDDKPGQPLPEPPMIFLSLFDSCDTIYRKVVDAEVIQQKIKLSVNRHTCARCAMTIQTLHGERVDVKVTCHFGNDKSSAIPYEESTCHPRMIPKYSRLIKVVGGIAHIVTFRQFWGRWPSFGNIDEVCLACNKPPSSVGCIQVGKAFEYRGGSIPVDHSSQVAEHIVIEVEDDDDQPLELDEHQPAEDRAQVVASYANPVYRIHAEEHSRQPLDTHSSFEDKKG